MEFNDPVGAHQKAGIPVLGEVWQDVAVVGEDVSSYIFQDCTFERVRLEGMNLEQTMFINTRFDDCAFIDCRLAKTVFNACGGAGFGILEGHLESPVITDCRFERLVVAQAGSGVTLAESALDEVMFEGEGTRQNVLTISGCEIKALHAEHAIWHNASAVEVDLGVWALAHAAFTRCSFIRSEAVGVDLSDVEFDACNLYESNLAEARVRNAAGSIFADCNLARANFDGAALTGALFSKANAAGASFERAELEGAMFPHSVLVGARLAGCRAHGSVWNDADLTDADLGNFDAYRSAFRNAVFRGANVAGARFVESDLHGVEETLAGADLRDCRDTVEWRAEHERELKAGG